MATSNNIRAFNALGIKDYREHQRLNSDIQKNGVEFVVIIFMMSGRIPDPIQKFYLYAKENLTFMQKIDPITTKSNGERLGLETTDFYSYHTITCRAKKINNTLK